MKRKLPLLLLVAILASSLSFGAEIKKVSAVPDGEKVRIEVDLSVAITPTITMATKPDRLIIDFPDAAPEELLQHLPVDKNGVKRVRVGLNRDNPPVTRVVVDLDRFHPYQMVQTGRRVVLAILPASGETSDQAKNLSTSSVSVTAWLPALLPAEASETKTPIQSASRQPLPRLRAKSRLRFRVKYVAERSVYLDGGSNSGLQEGMKLLVRDSAAGGNQTSRQRDIAELQIVAVATTSAIAEVHAATRDIKRGDFAFLAPADAAIPQILAAEKALPPVSKLPRTPLLASRAAAESGEDSGPPSTRIRGQIGFDYSGISSGGSTPGTSHQVGLSFQSDMTNLFGTHWNLQGYWRGRVNRHSQFQQDEVSDPLNKTYTMQLYYDNPNSAWVAGFGRLYLPWAVSLDTIDGGYVGRKLGHGATAGVFAGSRPDITSWDYAPDHRIAGSFVNLTGGDYDGFHFSSTSGFALSTLQWRLDRPYLFFDNKASYRQWFSVYHSLIADDPLGVTTDGIRPGTGISHSYLTVHLQPSQIVSFDLYHNYFRDVPTAATRIVGTGLVDKLLFQGVSAGVHVQPIKHVIVYTTLGRSEKTGDVHRTLNQMYGLTWSEIARTGIRADVHYSKFDRNFGRGNYRVLSLSRKMTDRTFWNVQLGNQKLASPFTANTNSNFLATSFDLNLGRHCFVQSGYTFLRGATLNDRQWYLSWGYRFDEKRAVDGQRNH